MCKIICYTIAWMVAIYSALWEDVHVMMRCNQRDPLKDWIMFCVRLRAKLPWNKNDMDRLTEILHRQIRVDRRYNHEERIIEIYRLIREACEKEFNEESPLGLDCYLREWFEASMPKRFDPTRQCCFCGADNRKGVIGYAGERSCPSCGKGGDGEPDEERMFYKGNL